jgi:hypothetical protein
MDLLTTYTYHSELQVITALSLISALYSSLAHAKSSQSSLDVFWQRLLTVEILQLLALRSSCHSHPCRTVNLTIAPSLLSLPYQPSTDRIAPFVFFITPRCGRHRKHHSSIVACVFVSVGTCLPSRFSETAICLFAYRIATAVLVCFEVFAQQPFYMPQYRQQGVPKQNGPTTDFLANDCWHFE